jgi:hypothetical protein
MTALGSIGLIMGALLWLGGTAAGSELPAQVPSGATPVATPQSAGTVVARPELTLQLRDLPPGYAENTPLDLTFRGTPIEDRRIRRAGSGAGPYSVWSAVFEPGITLTQEDVDAIAVDLATLFTRLLAPNIETSDWQPLDAEGLGDHAAVYSFRTLEPEGNLPGDGALAVISRDGLLTYVRLLSGDGGAVVDLRRLARLLDDRIRRLEAPASGADRPAP